MCELFLLLKTFIPLFSNWHYLSKTYFDYFWEGKHKSLRSVCLEGKYIPLRSIFERQVYFLKVGFWKARKKQVWNKPALKSKSFSGSDRAFLASFCRVIQFYFHHPALLCFVLLHLQSYPRAVNHFLFDLLHFYP